MRKLFIGNISWDATEEDLRALFEQYGAVESVKLIVDQYTGRSRGFAFVVMNDVDAAKAAIEALNEKPFKGRPIRVTIAEDTKRREGGGSGGGYSGGREGYNREGGGNYRSREGGQQGQQGRRGGSWREREHSYR